MGAAGRSPQPKAAAWRSIQQTTAACGRKDGVMTTILIIVLVVLLLGGFGGYHGYNRYGGTGLGGVLGLVLVVLLVLWLAGGLHA
jgi:hypothetical protein